MTRAQQLVFCKKCTHRKMDINEGLLCGLTARQADFQTECPSYNNDPEVIERLDNEEVLKPQDAKRMLSENAIAQIRSEQSLPTGIFVGIAAGIIGAIIWAAITVTTGYQIGYIALAVGALVGFAIRIFGKGIDPIFGIAGAVIAILSCFLGNILGQVGFGANEYNLGYTEALFAMDYGILIPAMLEDFDVRDILFYGIAGYEGYKFAFKPFTEQEIAKLQD